MKKVIAAAAIVVLVLAGLVFLLPLALSSDTLRTALADQLSDASGAEISLNGPIHFSVVPDFGIVVEDLTYASNEGAVLVSAARSVASVNLLSLFSDQIRITGIELRSPRIVLTNSGTVAPTPAAQPEPAAGESADDIFKVVAGYLERLSIDHLDVSDGEIAQSREGVVTPIANDIDLRLSVPGISEPASLVISGVVDDNRMELAADIGSLRDLLGRQPATFSLSAKTERPPHPGLADVSASGSIQLADDGSYRITGGEIDSIGQKMRLDASYTPGERPFIMARVAAGTLNYSDFQPTQTSADDDAAEAASASADGPDLSALRDFDADIELRAEAMQAGQAIARDVVIGAQLRSGQLEANLSSSQIAGGSLAASLLMDVNPEIPQSSGSLDLAAIDIESLMALAGQEAPASGALSSQLVYAFFGADADTIRSSANVRGEVSITGGRMEVPQLADLAGPGADQIDALDATARIEDIRQPLGVSGTARWKGEAVGFSTSLALSDLMSGEASEAAVEITSQPLNASFSGTVALDGALAGRAEITAASLSRALGWFGQDTGTPLGRFGFSGGISVGGNAFGVSDATIDLDDINAKGSLSVETAGKPKITATLAVDALDFGSLTGGGTASTAGASSGPAPIDLSILRQIDADIRLEANQLGYGDIKAGPATATLSVADGVARLSVPQASFYEGTVTANVTANGAGDVPAIELVAGMDGVQALPFLTDAAGFQHIEGGLKADVQVTGSGGNTEAFARSLNGPVSVVFSDGALRGIDVAGIVRNLQSVVYGGYTENAEAKTEFTELSVSLGIENGVGRSQDLRLLGPFVRMSGEGSIDLAAQTIDMRLDPRVVASLDGQGGEFDVSGLGMPIIVTGALAGPSIYPDISGILANPDRALQALAQLGGGVGDLAAGATDSIGGLDGILGGDPEAVSGGVTGLVNRLGGNQLGGEAGGLPANGQDLLNTLLGGAMGQQAPQPQQASASQAPSLGQQAVQTPEAPQPGQLPPETALAAAGATSSPATEIPLPRRDPRTASLAASAQAQQQPAGPATLSDQLLDAIAPQTAPADAGGNNADLIRGLIERVAR